MYEQLFFKAHIGMFIVGFCCFIILYFIPAGYGKWANNKLWGFSFNNKIAWLLMEIPTLIVFTAILILNISTLRIVPLIVGAFYVVHYIQRAFIFPFMLKGSGKIPLLIVLLSVCFNVVNATLIASWLFYFAPDTMYTVKWLYSPQFIIGCLVFIIGMYINISSDSYIRSLRKPGDSNHYFPKKGFYKYVTSANYFGEIVEWIGFAILSWSLPAVLFVFWTAANLVPRSHFINKKYKHEFSEEFSKLKPKKIFPFVY